MSKTKKAMKQLLALTLSFAIALTLLVGISPQAETTEEVTLQSALPFTDVTSSDWFYSYVRSAFESGIMLGTSETVFSPRRNFSRSMVVATLFRIYHDRPANTEDSRENPFNDVPANQWFAPYISWAYNNGIVEGLGEGRFAPQNSVNRQQFATMLYRFADNMTDFDTTVQQGPQWNQFDDRNQIASWALDATIWANYHELITGRTSTTIAPRGTTRRAEAATMLTRFLERVESEETAQPMVSAGGNRTLYIKADGSLWAWGGNWGDATQIQPGTTWSSVSGGLGIRTDGSLWAFRGNYWDEATQIQPGTTWSSVSGENRHRLGIRTDGSLWQWGVSTQITESSPVQIEPGTTWSSVTGGSDHSLGIRTDGSLWAWGSNWSGQLGDGTGRGSSESPVQIQPGTTWSSVATGTTTAYTSFDSWEESYVLGIRTDGSLWAWGSSRSGQFGNGTTRGSSSSPVQIQPGTTWSSVSARDFYVVGIRTDGSLWHWGRHLDGRFIITSPVQIQPGTTWSSVSVGGRHAVGIRTDGNVWAWGLNGNGQLGDGTTTDSHSPVQIHIPE